jgi:DNA gyrase subunit A
MAFDKKKSPAATKSDKSADEAVEVKNQTSAKKPEAVVDTARETAVKSQDNTSEVVDLGQENGGDDLMDQPTTSETAEIEVDNSPFTSEEGETYETEKTDHGLVIRKPIIDEMSKSYLDYAMSVIVARALPDVRDGLKPVHRRILYAMHSMGLRWNSSYKKSATVVGEVLGKYHPHGDSAVYDALVRLAQDFSMRYPLVDGQGNFGSIDGDSPAAMRYTEARMARITEELLADIEKNTVDFIDNFDGSRQEPQVLPARLPNLLLMGAEGIAVGMATKIPPHNLKEVAAAITETINKGRATTPETTGPESESAITEESTTKKDKSAGQTKFDPVLANPQDLAGEFTSDITVEDILEHINGPDFPTGGIIYDWNAIKDAYATGRGRITMRAKAEIVQEGKGNIIEITELPYQVNKAKLIAKIADLVRNKKLDGISNIRDDSDRQGLSVVVELKRGARPKSILNNLFKQTELQSNFSMNMVALNSDGVPQLMNIRRVIMEFVSHRQLVTVRRFQFELKGLRERAHILEGLLIALANLDDVIETIRKSADSEVAKTRLMERFKLSEAQAIAILDMQLRKLAALERQKIEDEYKQIKLRIDEIITILTDPQKILQVIVDEIKQLVDQYGDDRRTKLNKGKIGEFNEEDLVPNDPTIVAYTTGGYIKRMNPDAYRVQRRGGKGVSGMKTKEDDLIKEIISCRNHDTLLLFTNKGRVFASKVYELPEGSRQSKGTALVNIINLESEEIIQNILVVPKGLDVKKSYILFATKEGRVKKTAVSEFENIRSNGIIAIVLKPNDTVVFTKLTSGQDDVLMVTRSGKSIRFPEEEVKISARDTQGVQGIKLKKDDYVVGGQAFPRVAEKPADGRRRFFRQLLIITQRGMGKRTDLDEYPIQKRAGQGVKVSEVTTRTGPISAALLVTQDHEDLILTTQEAQVIKLPIKNIPVLKRPTQGVILMRMPVQEKIVAATVTKRELDDEDEE